MKVVDRKKQHRTTLDTILQSLVENGRIYAAKLHESWKSIQPYLNKKRLIHFLETHKVLLAKKALEVIGRFNKSLAKGIPPHCIAT